MVVQGKLTTRVQQIIHNNLIMQWEKISGSYSLLSKGGSLHPVLNDLLVEEVIKAWLINLLFNG